MQIERESNFELLRLVSMFFIVLYHLLMWLVLDDNSAMPMKSFWLPLHVGVICFVLLSGYFQIRPSVRGILRLVSVFFVFSLPEIIYGCANASTLHGVCKSLLFISHSHYWFVRSYLGLYLISPLINKYLDYSSNREKLYLLFVCILVSVYFGMVSKSSIYHDGKNIVNFLLIYQLGHLLKVFKSHCEKISIWTYLIFYIIINVTLVISYLEFGDSYLGSMIWRFSFPYNSPILILNAIILFLIFGKISLNSLFVNRVARGCFAIYLIHCITPMVSGLERKIVLLLFHSTSSIPFFFLELSFMALIIMSISLAVYFLFSPIWHLIEKAGSYIQERFCF